MALESTGSDLGPQPDPEIEPGEPNPGGADAIDAADGVDGERAEPDPAPRDLDPERNPADQGLPEEMKAGEDTSTEATKGVPDEGREVTPEEESPA